MSPALRVRMSRMSEYETWSTLRDYLALQLIHGSGAIALGAGTSVHFGLPNWDQLIQRLYARHGDTPPSKSATIQAERFKNKYHPGDRGSFDAEIKAVLYENLKISFDYMMSHHTLAATLSMLMAAGPGRRTEVVTFNWDNLLEKYLALHGQVVIPVHAEKHWAQFADVTVFHPHGFLPYMDDSNNSERVIFDQLSYDEILASNTIWRQTLLGLFRTRTCILIGLSGEDPHLSSLLLQVKSEHASLNNGTLFWAVTFTEDKATEKSWQDRGVYALLIKDHSEIPKRLFEITEAAVSMRSK
jgi:hypothetical protein